MMNFTLKSQKRKAQKAVPDFCTVRAWPTASDQWSPVSNSSKG